MSDYWLHYGQRGQSLRSSELSQVAPSSGHLLTAVAQGRGLFWEIIRRLSLSGVSIEMVVVQVAAFVSLLTQGQADAAWPNGERINIGASGITVGVSNSGKSAIFKLLANAIERFMAEHAMGGDREPAFFIGDPTREAAILHLDNWRFAALFSDDGGNLLHMFNQAAPTLATALDGTPLRHARVSTGRIQLLHYRLSLYLGFQPEYFSPQWLLKASTSGAGVPNRMLFSRAPEPLLGERRALLTLTPELARSWELKVNHHLQAVAQNALGKPKPLPFMRLAPEAKSYMEALICGLAPSSPAPCPAAYMSRHPERVLRFAGSLEVLENGIEGDISLESVKSADTVCRMSLDVFRELTYIQPTLSQAQLDAVRLYSELMKTAARTGITCYARADLRRYAPNMGLTPQSVERALPVLIDEGRAWIVGRGKKDYVQLLTSSYPTYVQ